MTEGPIYGTTRGANRRAELRDERHFDSAAGRA